jgi:hypothetical protein
MTDAEYGELMQIIMMASSTNAMANAMQVPIDPEFQAG